MWMPWETSREATGHSCSTVSKMHTCSHTTITLSYPTGRIADSWESSTYLLRVSAPPVSSAALFVGISVNLFLSFLLINSAVYTLRTYRERSTSIYTRHAFLLWSAQHVGLRQEQEEEAAGTDTAPLVSGSATVLLLCPDTS